MAQLLHLSLNEYSNIEHGGAEMTISRLEPIAKIFDMTYLDLLNMGEKNNGIYFSGNNQNGANYQINGDGAVLSAEIEKLKTENIYLKEKIVLLENTVADLREIIAISKSKS
jgi:transcriptional regulator with XRE-family HTH domain